MQELIIIVLFALAAGYLGWRALRSVNRTDAGCGKGCGCAVDKAAVKSAGPGH